MSKNKVQDGDILRLVVAATVKAGDPVAVGNAFRGVAMTDYNANDGCASIDTEGVYDLSVQAVDDAGNSAVAIGDRLYYGGSATPWLSKKKSGKFFGVALETVTTGTTATINVLIGEVSGADRSAFQVFAGGVSVVNDSPLAAAEFIPVTGVLATDVVIAQMSVNGGSPRLYIIKAVASVSPDGITVTASGVYTAGDSINWVVLRPAL